MFSIIVNAFMMIGCVIALNCLLLPNEACRVRGTLIDFKP